MAIETTEKCDVCAALIEKDPQRPGFPQLSWCYFRKSLGVFANAATGEPLLQDHWPGDVNRLEFCAAHGRELNALLKAFHARDSGLLAALAPILAADDAAYAARQEKARQDHKAAVSVWAQRKADEVAAADARATAAANRAAAASAEKAHKKEARAAEKAAGKKGDG